MSRWSDPTLRRKDLSAVRDDAKVKEVADKKEEKKPAKPKTSIGQMYVQLKCGPTAQKPGPTKIEKSQGEATSTSTGNNESSYIMECDGDTNLTQGIESGTLSSLFQEPMEVD